MKHNDLDAWKHSIKFVRNIYELTSSFPPSEEFGLKRQLRKAAISVPSNLAEGSARKSDNELIQFLYISLGSLAEIETQLIISKELGFTNMITEQLAGLKELNKLFQGLINYLKSKKT